ncbi:MAG: hypothetical protein RQ757_14145, partial [Pseudomonadales bacterium]|nr:hypothetical protein [Pseudomonadales bacterium]
MDSINTTRQFIQHHFPRNHLLLAGLLAVVLVVILTLFPEQADPDNHSQLIVLPIIDNHDTLPGKTGSEENDANTLSLDTGLIATEQLEANTLTADSTTTEPMPVAAPEWQELEIQTGDNLSAVFN